jgi:hypothetical protein
MGKCRAIEESSLRLCVCRSCCTCACVTLLQGQLAATAEAQAAMAEAQAAATAAMAAAAAANLRQSFAEGTAAAGAAAGSQQCSRAASPASLKAAGQPPAAAVATVSGGGSATAFDAVPEYPYVRESATPTDTPLLPGAGSGPEAALAAAAAATPGSLSAEPSVELEVLGQQKLVTGSIFGPGYWGGPERRCSSTSASGDRPQEAGPVTTAAAAGNASAAPAATGTALSTAGACGAREGNGPAGSITAWVDPRAMSPVVSPTADSTSGEGPAAQAAAAEDTPPAPEGPATGQQVPAESWPAAAPAVQRRRMTYGTGLHASRADRDTRQTLPAAAVERYLAGAAAAVGTDGGYGGVTDTFAAGRLSPATAAADVKDGKDGKKKMGWLTKVRLGRSSKSKEAAAAAGGEAVGDAYTTSASPASTTAGSRKPSRADKAAAAKAKKQQAAGGQQRQLLPDTVTAAPAHKPAGGVLFGRWGKQARKGAGAAGAQVCMSGAGAGGAPAPLQDWPSLRASGALADGPAAAAASMLGQPPSRDVTGGGDQAAPTFAAGADSSAGGAAGIHVLYPTKAAAAEMQPASGKRWRRLLGGSSTS